MGLINRAAMKLTSINHETALFASRIHRRVSFSTLKRRINPSEEIHDRPIASPAPPAKD
jgi:hypothetical protein